MQSIARSSARMPFKVSRVEMCDLFPDDLDLREGGDLRQDIRDASGTTLEYLLFVY